MPFVLDYLGELRILCAQFGINTFVVDHYIQQIHTKRVEILAKTETLTYGKLYELGSKDQSKLSAIREEAIQNGDQRLKSMCDSILLPSPQKKKFTDLRMQKEIAKFHYVMALLEKQPIMTDDEVRVY